MRVWAVVEQVTPKVKLEEEEFREELGRGWGESREFPESLRSAGSHWLGSGFAVLCSSMAWVACDAFGAFRPRQTLEFIDMTTSPRRIIST